MSITQIPLPEYTSPTWDELTDSGGGSVAFNAYEFSKKYVVCGAADETVVVNLVEAQLLAGYSILTVNGVPLFIYDYKIELLSNTDGTQWVVTLNYKFKVAYFELSGDATGGTKNVKQALDEPDEDGVIGRYYNLQKADDPKPNFGGLIGVDGEDVKGVDVPDYKREFTVLIRDQYSTLPSDYLETLESMIGCANEDELTISFKDQDYDYDIGELLFLGYIDKQTSDDGVELMLKFSVQRSQDMPVIGNSEANNDDESIFKRGWDYAWVYSATKVVNGWRQPVPQTLVINQVVYYDDFTPIGIFT